MAKKNKKYNHNSAKQRQDKFKKKIVVFCIGFIVLYTVVQTYLSYRLGIELSPVLTGSVYAFFGTELMTCAFASIFEK